MLQRAVRDMMTEHAGVVRDEAGLRSGLAELDRIEARMGDVGVHPAEIAAEMREDVSTAGKLVE